MAVGTANAQPKRTPAPKVQSAKAKAADATAVGERVIALRVDGKSFKAIAADLDLGKSTDAFGVFVEAVGRRPKAEQVQLRADEGKRLDALERWTRRKSEPDAMDRKLAIVASLRAQLAAT